MSESQPRRFLTFSRWPHSATITVSGSRPADGSDYSTRSAGCWCASRPAPADRSDTLDARMSVSSRREGAADPSTPPPNPQPAAPPPPLDHTDRFRLREELRRALDFVRSPLPWRPGDKPTEREWCAEHGLLEGEYASGMGPRWAEEISRLAVILHSRLKGWPRDRHAPDDESLMVWELFEGLVRIVDAKEEMQLAAMRDRLPPPNTLGKDRLRTLSILGDVLKSTPAGFERFKAALRNVVEAILSGSPAASCEGSEPTPAANSSPPSAPPVEAERVVLSLLANRFRVGSSVVTWKLVYDTLLQAGFPVRDQRRLVRQTLAALHLEGAVEPIHKPPRHNPYPMVIFEGENEPDEWRILPRAVSLAAEMGKGTPQTDTGERAPIHLLQDGEQPHHREVTATSTAGTDKTATENRKQDSKTPPPNGPFDDLRDAGNTLKLKGKMAAVVRLLCERAGRVPLVDLALECEWATNADENSAVYVNSWNSLRYDLNKKLKKHGWRLVQHDLCAVAERLKPSAGKS